MADIIYRADRAVGDEFDLEPSEVDSNFAELSRISLSWAVYSTNTTAVPGSGYLFDNSVASRTLTLPLAPFVGDVVGIGGFLGNFFNNNLIVSRNLELIDGASSDLVVRSSLEKIILVYSGASRGWVSFKSTVQTTNDYLVVGDILTTRATSTPSGFLPCDGSLYLSSSYPSLAARLSTVRSPMTVSTRTAASNRVWESVCWSPQLTLFCAVASSGTGNRVMTSPDGVNWTSQTTPADNTWQSVCWSPELSIFCAVSRLGTDRVMTSPNGVDWTLQTAPALSWYSVCWSPQLTLFCAVGLAGGVMTSPNGVNWTAQTAAASNDWRSVCWSPALTLFCAVAGTGTGNRVMTSPNGVNWTAGTKSVLNFWRSVCWSPELGIFCAVSGDTSGMGNRVMTSPDGVNWLTRNSTIDFTWTHVAWSPEMLLFVAVSFNSFRYTFMVSKDGEIWDAVDSKTGAWYGICWSPQLAMFCVVGAFGTGTNRAATIEFLEPPVGQFYTPLIENSFIKY